MPRPRTPVGSWGEISEPKPTSSGTFEVSARIRLADGSLPEVSARGRSGSAAKTRLREKLARMADEIKSGDISPETSMSKIADLWLEQVKDKYADRHSNTPRTYENYVKNWVKPAIGQLQAGECRATQISDLVKKGRKQSYATAKSLKTVLSGICGYAVVHGAMERNWAKELERIEGSKKKVVALSKEQRDDLKAKLTAYGPTRQLDKRKRSVGARGRIWLELPDLHDAMLSTGVRLGELLALDGVDVDPQARTVTICHHLLEVNGQGLIRVEDRKGRDAGLVLEVPSWSVEMWRRRKLASGGGPLFPGPSGYRRPSNVIEAINTAMGAVGYGWVTSHVWRKTVATVLDEAGLPTTAIADQLGNTARVVEKHYRAPRVGNGPAAAALESM